jgi:hypothetical protein
LVFNQLPFEADPSATNGFKLKIRAVCNTASATNALQYVRIDTVTTSSAQNAVSYPLDPVSTSLQLTGLKANSEVRVFRSSDDVELAGIEDSGTSFTYDYEWTGADVEVYVVIHHLDWLPIRYEDQILGEDGLTLPIQQQTDRQYLNP